MILIQKNSVNINILTLAEKTTIAVPYYLFEFIQDQSKVKKYFIGVDLSTNKQRYNRFDIEENVVENLLIGKVSLELTDFGKYTIRQQASSTNLDPLLSGSIVEDGKYKVTKTNVADPVFTEVAITIKTFNG